MKTIIITIALFLCLFIWAGSSITPNSPKRPKAQKGVLDLRDWDFDNNGIAKLDGEWEFYWQKLLSDSNKSSTPFDTYLNVPSSWENENIGSQKLPLNGYGTYRLIVLLNNKNIRMRLNTPPLMPASRFYVNNKLVGWSGKIIGKDSTSINKIDIIPEFNNHFIDFKTNSDTLEIIVHTVNYQVEKSGLNFSLALGNSNEIQSKNRNNLLIYIFLIGVFFIMCLYHISLWILHRKDNALIYFALLCITLSSYFFHKSNLINFIFNTIDFETSFKFLRISLFSTTPAFAIFIHAFFPKEYNKKIAYSIIVYGIICMLIVLFTPAIIHCKIAVFYRVYIIVSVFVSFSVIFIAFFRKRKYSGLFLFGFGIFGITATNDVLLNLEVIQSTDLLQYGLFSFILTNAIILSSRFSNAYNAAEKLSNDLSNINENLEVIVQVRTLELAQRNEEIENQTKQIEQQNINLELYNNQIKESLVYASRIQNALLPAPKQSGKLLDYFVFLQPKDIVSGDFYWNKVIDQYQVFVVADCTGHGVSGAFMSILGISFLNEIIMNKSMITKPNLVLENISKKIANALNHNDFDKKMFEGMDISIFAIDTVSQKLYYSGAKLPLYIIRNDNFEYIKHRLQPNQFGIGISSINKTFEFWEYQLINGDAIYTHSDGIIDQFGGTNNKKFNQKRFEELLINIQPYTLEYQRKSIKKAFEDWKGNDWFQVDDVIVLGVKVWFDN